VLLHQSPPKNLHPLKHLKYEISSARIDDVLRVGALVRIEGRSVNGQLIVERIRVEDDDD
jgi:hypothetical protein